MADRITAKNSDSKFAPHPVGQFVALCVDTIDLGEAVTDYPGTPKYLSQKCVLVFRTGEKNPETGDLIDLSGEYTVSMGEKSKLRPFLEGWRGRKYTQEEADEGVPLDKLVGKYALLSADHKKSAKGRTYAIILGAVSVPKSMSLPTFPAYTRAEFWAEKRAEYKKAADQYRAEIGIDDQGNPVGVSDGFHGTITDDLPDPAGDDLPFSEAPAQSAPRPGQQPSRRVSSPFTA